MLCPPEAHYKLWHTIRTPFLYPRNFQGHACEWEQFSMFQAGCVLCGAEHRCGIDQKTGCPQHEDDDGHVICLITACVIRTSKHKDEFTCYERASVEHTNKSKQSRSAGRASNAPANTSIIPPPSEIWDFVNRVVREILTSSTTQECRIHESRRLMLTQFAALQKEIKRQRVVQSPNMLHIASEVTWQTRKLRRPIVLPKEQMECIVEICTNAIAKVLLTYNKVYVSKIFNSETRKREFTSSMLYLIRSGVECRGECILPKIPIISLLVPLETYLPEFFKIRSKSVTEGENLLKIEIRHMLKL